MTGHPVVHLLLTQTAMRMMTSIRSVLRGYCSNNDVVLEVNWEKDVSVEDVVGVVLLRHSQAMNCRRQAEDVVLQEDIQSLPSVQPSMYIIIMHTAAHKNEYNDNVGLSYYA